jgi:hypothetical protein
MGLGHLILTTYGVPSEAGREWMLNRREPYDCDELKTDDIGTISVVRRPSRENLIKTLEEITDFVARESGGFNDRAERGNAVGGQFQTGGETEHVLLG